MLAAVASLTALAETPFFAQVTTRCRWQCHEDYSLAYVAFAQTRSPQKLAEFYDAHNMYVQQLHATNGMIDQYYTVTLPKLLEELEDVSIFCPLLGAFWRFPLHIVALSSDTTSSSANSDGGSSRPLSGQPF